ncbi:DNA-binding protein BIN4 isoform X2 [Mangifera indica]|uniref:DNA-binding protein BIN4 isoform X2 n=1 Tax=Mangifera indica TaxID=29780 RepID=UPI001CFC1C88|nr:DNA-binding protein BIN4 isoform X2 [Mangifera indica]
MAGTKEESPEPDWLRTFQAPTLNHSIMALSSDSDSSVDAGKPGVDVKVEPEAPRTKSRILSLNLSSDSESCGDDTLIKNYKPSKLEEQGGDEDAAPIGLKGKSPRKKASKENGRKVTDEMPTKEKDVNNDVKRKENDGHEDLEEEVAEKHNKPSVYTSTLPLILPEKVHRTKALVECEGESIDLSGDMGAVGRIIVPDVRNGNHDMFLDLKGTIYGTTIVPSRTFCVVSFGQSEAKIEAIMNDFIQLKPQGNVFGSETMVEGTLDDFSFDSDDEAVKKAKATSQKVDQNDGVEDETNGNTKAKADKPFGRKRGSTGGGKAQPPKKPRKKPVSKKGKAKK